MNGSVNLGIEMYFLEALGAWFADVRTLDDGKPGPVLASTHLWADKNDCLNELFVLLAAAEVATV